MPTRDHIIYWSITTVLFVGTITCVAWYHTRVQIPLDGERQSVIEMMAPYAALISAIAALVSAVAAVFISLRKTERQRIDELKDRMRVILSENGEYAVRGYDGKDELFQRLDPKCRKPKYKALHQLAYDELKSEGKIRERPPPGYPPWAY